LKILGFGSAKKPTFDWSPLPPPSSEEEFKSRVEFDNPLIEREPERLQEDWVAFSYLDALPECKGILKETLIASGPSSIFFSDGTKHATAFLTDKRLVHLHKFRGLLYATGGFHNQLSGIRVVSQFRYHVEWRGEDILSIQFGPHFTRNSKNNRYALEWNYSFAKIAKEKFSSA
jgi:hypothetical protein